MWSNHDCNAIDDNADTQTADDACPRAALGLDPNPDGSIGADVKTDVFIKWPFQNAGDFSFANHVADYNAGTAWTSPYVTPAPTISSA